MTGSELKAAAIQLFGEQGWRHKLADALGYEQTQIWRYIKNDHVPRVVELAVQKLLEDQRR